MPDLIQWFFDHILPYLTISVIGGAWFTFRRVDTLRADLKNLASEHNHLSLKIEDKWKILEEKIRDDINEVRDKLDYIQTHNVSRDELNQYLHQLNLTVSRLSETINRLL